MKTLAWILRLCALGSSACSAAALTGISSGDAGADSAESDAAPTGTMCTVPTTSSGMLCEGLTTCPTLTVDQNAWHGCGFLVDGKVVALFCECSGYLCTAGSTPTCADAVKLLGESSASVTCNQLSSGGCVFEGLGGATGSGGTTCDTACESTCVDPSCIQACGC